MKKCRHCGNRFEPRFSSLERFCWNPECKTIDAMEKLDRLKKNESKQWNIQRKKIREKLKTTSDWKNDLQKTFNEFIRIRDKHKPCISCGRKLPEKFDAGHFHSVGSSPSLRFNESNVHGQCVHCNRDKHGNLHEYRVGLIQRVGNDVVDELDAKRHESRKWTQPEIVEMIQQYKMKIKLLKKM